MGNSANKMSLTFKFILTVLCVGVTIASASVVVSAVLNINASKETARSNLGTIAADNATVSSYWLRQKVKQIKVLAVNQDVVDYFKDKAKGEKELAALLKSQKAVYNELWNATAIDINSGKILVDGRDGEEVGANITSYEFWAHRMDEAPFFGSSLAKTAVGNGLIFTLSQKVVDEKGQAIGLVVLAIDWMDFASNSFKSIKVGKTGYLFVIDKDAVVIYHPSNESLIQNKEQIFDFSRKAAASKDLFQKYQWEGATKYLYSKPIPETGWIMCANVTESELLAGSTSAIILSVIFSIVILVVASIISALIARSISKPINTIVQNLSASSSQIGISSTQLSESSQMIANGASEQASGIEETSASMEELASVVRLNVENSKQASILSDKASQASGQGSEKMGLMLSAMNNIAKSGEDIKAVIDVIDDIAFQTNMLALNAAVEAARAGEAGMGFAVVADEVKNLANRSSESAKETAKMIKETIKNVEEGLGISKDLAEIFTSILGNTGKALEMNKEVEKASSQQSEGIDQTNKALAQFDTVVQANAASSEETASAAEELQSQVVSLNEVVSQLYNTVTGKEYHLSQGATGQGLAHPAQAGKAPRPTVAAKRDAGTPTPRAISGNQSKQIGPGTHLISFEDDEAYKG